MRVNQLVRVLIDWLRSEVGTLGGRINAGGVILVGVLTMQGVALQWFEAVVRIFNATYSVEQPPSERMAAILVVSFLLCAWALAGARPSERDG